MLVIRLYINEFGSYNFVHVAIAYGQVIMRCLPHDVVFECVNASVTAQLCCVGSTAPVYLVVHLFFLDVTESVTGFQLNFSLLTLDESKVGHHNLADFY